MSGFNIPGFELDAKKLSAEVEKLHNAIQHGALERRRNLFDKLGELIIAYAMECKFDHSLRTIEELTELSETLVEEGQFEYRKELAMYLSNAISFVRPMSRMKDVPCDLAPFYKHLSRCVEGLAEDEFNEIKNEWALDVHQYAEVLHEENQATVAAIALLDRTINTLEQHFNPYSSQFTDWHPLLTMYSSRGHWKFEIGDRESALADLLHYEELAEQATQVQERRRQEVSSRTTQQGDKIIIRIRDDDLIDHLASFNFDDQYYDTMFQLADMFASRADQNKAFEYYDKALAIAKNTYKTDPHLQVFSAAGEIPFRKGHMALQFHEFETALQFFDLSAQEFRALLQTDKKHHFEAMEKRLAEVERCRAEALEHLGRFEEASQAIDEMQKIYTKSLTETAGISKAAQAEREKNRPFASMFQPPEKEEKKSTSDFRQNKKKQPVEEDLEEIVQSRITAKHNDAVADCRRGNIELHRGHWKTALTFLLKARYIFDSPLFQTFPETQVNLCSVYAGIAGAYCSLSRYDESERWYRNAMTQFQKLINEGRLDLQPAFFETLTGQALLFSSQNKYEESIRLYEKVYEGRNRLVAENLEGLNIEHLRTHDSQRLAPSALLLQLQCQTLRAIQERLCALDRVEDAIIWGQREVEIFGQFVNLLPDPDAASFDYCVAKISCACLLLLCKRYDEADVLLNACEQTFIEHARAEREQKHSDGEHEHDDNEHEHGEDDNDDLTEIVRKKIDQLVFIRLFDLIEDSKHRDIKHIFYNAHSLIHQNKGSKTEPILESLREPIRKLQIETQKEHRSIHKFWQDMEKMIDLDLELSRRDLSQLVKNAHDLPSSPFDLPTKKGSKTVIEPEEDSEELNRELAQCEKDFGGEKGSNEFLYQILDEVTGNSTASNMMRKFDKGEFQVSEDGQPFRSEKTVGRNDPCPCGSGKKYKKCCMKKE
ncbi:MAG: SEC-C domain-containing protein [Planctomycetaceae bacterium]|jgi:tetratricopeptide (TPR) repeat protein|nr:SEC-C domain-containing protein [Planctomycetaceae bacterium]